MPFTPVHTLAIMPFYFWFRKLPLAALAIGAMIPDFPMFIPVGSYWFSHSLIGLFLYCLPAGLIAFMLFESLGKQFIIDNSPNYLQSRLQCYRNTMPMGAKTFLYAGAAIITGAITHIVWDGFTHKGGWGVEWLSVLQQRVEFLGYKVPYFKVLQHGSTLFGGLLLLLLCWRMLQKMPPVETVDGVGFSSKAVAFIVLSFLAVPVVIFLFQLLGQSSGLGEILGRTIKQSISGGLTLLLFYSLIFKFWITRRTYFCKKG
ncbi:DUF4184 family protein [Hahella ganghwensis]|uniref:DUF4184 family protein n=1 Tax=Hahella ganghwensis TaxID=286420 RepID=UPI000368763A|nr:DUF4184 family protein [Hahella ganghwensis]